MSYLTNPSRPQALTPTDHNLGRCTMSRHSVIIVFRSPHLNN